MKIVVAGGSGFLGAHLCRKLSTEGHEVFCIDDGSSSDISSIKSLDVKFINHDITVPFDIEVDQIYNLACPASPKQYQANPIKTILTNVQGSYNLLELARKYRARILQASTSEVYGDPEVTPQYESYFGRVNPIGVRSCYDEGKRCAESMFFSHQKEYGTDIRVMRIFNTYGPGMHVHDGRVISNFVTQALLNLPITIEGSGCQTRSFCYVDDLIQGMVMMMNGQDIGPINFGTQFEISIYDLANRIIKLTNSKSVIKFCPAASDDPFRRCPDTTKADQIGWKPTTSLDDGLVSVIKYFNGVLLDQKVI